jgi:nucleoside-diphosphate-sugar epimerase
MRFLVLGGTAWLGREVVAAALAAGHAVTALARGTSGPPPEGARMVRADRTRPDAYDEVNRDWDVVVDLSRQPGQVRGAVAQLGERAGAWVFVSSASVYAAHDTPGADEGAELLPAHEEDDDGAETYGGRKVACEQAVLHGIPDRSLVARAGLIAGPGDHTDRTGYWPLRFAHPATADGAVLVPDSELGTQVVDVRDLAAWLVSAGAAGHSGVANAAGPMLPLGEHLATARAVAGHRDPVVAVPQDWLEAFGVEPWSGPRSLPLWLPLPEYAGFMARSTAAAQAMGLAPRPLEETLRDTLEWELGHGPGRVRKAGLAPADEQELVTRARADGYGIPSRAARQRPQ